MHLSILKELANIVAVNAYAYLYILPRDISGCSAMNTSEAHQNATKVFHAKLTAYNVCHWSAM